MLFFALIPVLLVLQQAQAGPEDTMEQKFLLLQTEYEDSSWRHHCYIWISQDAMRFRNKRDQPDSHCLTGYDATSKSRMYAVKTPDKPDWVYLITSYVNDGKNYCVRKSRNMDPCPSFESGFDGNYAVKFEYVDSRQKYRIRHYNTNECFHADDDRDYLAFQRCHQDDSEMFYQRVLDSGGGHYDQFSDSNTHEFCKPGQYFGFESLSCESTAAGCYNRYYVQISDCTEECGLQESSPPGSTSADQCFTCPSGSRKVGRLCLDCPPGTYEDGRECLDCPAGTFRSEPGASSVDMCLPCSGNDEFSFAGADSCSNCSVLAPSPSRGRVGHWKVGADHLAEQCECEDTFTGDACEWPKCPPVGPGLSLGALFLSADTKLRAFSMKYDTNDAEMLDAAENYIKDLLYVVLDVDGFGSITKTVVRDALTRRRITVNSDFSYYGEDAAENVNYSIPVWCSSTINPDTCYTEEVSVDVMYRDVLRNFHETVKHRADGSGINFVKEMTSIYPNSDWDDETCEKYDVTEGGAPLRTSWKWNFTLQDTTITDRQICGYNNALLDPSYHQTVLLNGSATEWSESNEFVNMEVNNKRVYCIAMEEALEWSIECAVGMFYDGTPMELQPELSMNGVVFSYLDTSRREMQFDILVGSRNSTLSQKVLAVTVDFASFLCGRFAKHINIVDTLSMYSVGKTVEYSIRAIERQGDVINNTGVYTLPYRIPFLHKVSGYVTTTSGVGVPNVVVAFTHIDAQTGLLDNASLASFVTNRFGLYSGMLRVSDSNWNNTAEMFSVKASKREYLSLSSASSRSVMVQSVLSKRCIDAEVLSTSNKVTLRECNDSRREQLFSHSLVTGRMETHHAERHGHRSVCVVSRGDDDVMAEEKRAHIMHDVCDEDVDSLHSHSQWFDIPSDASHGLLRDSSGRCWEVSPNSDDDWSLHAVPRCDSSNPSQLFAVSEVAYEDYVDHEFTPDVMISSLDHASRSTQQIFDNSSLSLFGSVVYDPRNVDGLHCPVGDVGIAKTVGGSAGEEAMSGANGAFSFSLLRGSDAQFTVDEFYGHTFNVQLTTSSGTPLVKDEHYSFSAQSRVLTIFQAAIVVDLNLTLVDISTQNVSMGVFGGAKNQYPIFGSETTLRVAAADSAYCSYSFDVSLSESEDLSERSRYKGRVAAMAYIVTMTESVEQAPVFPSFNRSASLAMSQHVYYCAPSVAPMQYFRSTSGTAMELSALVITNDTSKEPVTVVFIYHSGVCFQLKNVQYFALDYVTQSGLEGKQACYSDQKSYLSMDQSHIVTINLFEYYPQQLLTNYPDGAIAEKDGLSREYSVEDGVVAVFDQVSGISGLQYFIYDPVAASETISGGFEYTIAPSAPNVMYPFSWKFRVEVIRNDSRVIGEDFLVPVTGSKSKENANFYPVPANPDRIFLVLRDPPGGSSFATFKAKSTINMGLAVNSMHTYSGKAKFGYDAGASVYNKAGVVIGYGVAASKSVTDLKAGPSGMSSVNTVVKHTRRSVTHYDYEMSFTFDISTSKDPFIAGHASDVIVGGGIDLVVNEAIKVARVIDSPDHWNCFHSYDTNEWQPGRVTTFILAVVEIEGILKKLESKIIDMETSPEGVDEENLGKLKIQVANWNKVLEDYRRHNTDVVGMFDGLHREFNDMVNSFDKSRSDLQNVDYDFITSRYDFHGMSAATANSPSLTAATAKIIPLVISTIITQGTKMTPGRGLAQASLASLLGDAAVKGTGIIYALTFANMFKHALGSFSRQCQDVIPGYDSRNTDKVCKDFDQKKWSSLYDALTTQCNIDSGSGKSAHLSYFAAICRSVHIDKDQVPGGMKNGSATSTGMLGFLEGHERVLTFGAQSPVHLSYTSTVSDAVTLMSELENEQSDFDFGFKYSQSYKIVSTAVKSKAKFVTDILSIINVNKNVDTKQSSERTVDVTFFDQDQGDYFVVEVFEDPIFGTPVFKTLGGQSKCPGETATTRRESGVEIVEVVHKCGSDRRSRCEGLSSSEDVVLGVRVVNLSPSEDAVFYSLGFTPTYDYYLASDTAPQRICGMDGYKSGLTIRFSDTKFINLPYKQSIEIDILISNKMMVCFEYKQVELQIMATCEVPTAFSVGVYQYGFKYNESLGEAVISYEEADLINYPQRHIYPVSFNWIDPSITNAPSLSPTEDTVAPSVHDATAKPSSVPTAAPTTGMAALSQDFRSVAGDVNDVSASIDSLTNNVWLCVLLGVINSVGLMVLACRGQKNPRDHDLVGMDDGSEQEGTVRSDPAVPQDLMINKETNAACI